jgi:hypothetical protein
MAKVKTLQIEVAASQTGGELLDPGTGKEIILDWIVVSTASDISVEIWFGSAQTTANTLVHILRGGIDKDFRSPAHGSGIDLGSGNILKITNGAALTKVVIGYHINSNPVS